MTIYPEDRKHPTARDLRAIAASRAYTVRHRTLEAHRTARKASVWAEIKQYGLDDTIEAGTRQTIVEELIAAGAQR